MGEETPVIAEVQEPVEGQILVVDSVDDQEEEVKGPKELAGRGGRPRPN